MSDLDHVLYLAECCITELPDEQSQREAEEAIRRVREHYRWIPCSERMPEEGATVIGWRPGWDRGLPCWFNKEPECLGGRTYWSELDRGEDAGDVTYWMPLPKGPEVQG